LLPDDELCLCFHVTKRKVENFLRVERPRRASQISECFGAGTGCGWCRPFLQRLFDQAVAAGEVTPDSPADLPTADDYARQRSQYVLAGGGTPPPGATPIDPAAGKVLNDSAEEQ
jgi:bacterioferritin-associated ferredoxin